MVNIFFFMIFLLVSKTIFYVPLVILLLCLIIDIWYLISKLHTPYLGGYIYPWTYARDFVLPPHQVLPEASSPSLLNISVSIWG